MLDVPFDCSCIHWVNAKRKKYSKMLSMTIIRLKFTHIPRLHMHSLTIITGLLGDEERK